MAEAQGGLSAAAEPPAPRPTLLDDAAVAERLARLDQVLGQLERMPGATARTALDAAAMLAEVYGEALARVMARAAADPAMVRALTEDELVGHLLVLHGVHPAPVKERVAQALSRLRPALRSHGGGDTELDAIDGGVARVRLSAPGGCGTQKLEAAVREAVLAAAPELTAVETVLVRQSPPEAFVPVDALLARTAPGKGGAV